MAANKSLLVWCGFFVNKTIKDGDIAPYVEYIADAMKDAESLQTPTDSLLTFTASLRTYTDPLLTSTDSLLSSTDSLLTSIDFY